MKKTLVLLGALLILAPAARAQVDDGAMVGDVVEVTATIKAIDSAKRLISLEDQDGDRTTITAGPEVKRFSELKVGDKVTFRYAEAVLAAIAEAEPGAVPSAEVTEVAARGTGARPAGGVARQVKATVKVTALDKSAPSVTVSLPDGGTHTFDVDDVANLADIAVGDLVSISYTQALLISVK
jgi:Cu/Ag efflux protein CusF